MSPVHLLVAMIVILGLNQALIRFSLFARVPALFWVVQAMNLAVIVGVLIVGIPGLTGSAKLANWILALVLGLHTVQNYQVRLTALAETRRREIEEEWRELEARRVELARQEREAAPEPGRPD